MVESTALEMRRTGNCTEGSNPSLSAIESNETAIQISLKGRISKESQFYNGLSHFLVGFSREPCNHSIIRKIMNLNAYHCDLCKPQNVLSEGNGANPTFLRPKSSPLDCVQYGF